MKSLLKNHFVLLTVAITLMGLSAGFALYKDRVMAHELETSRLSLRIKQETELLYQNVWKMDISLRGYALVPEERFLFLKLRTCDSLHQRNVRRLDSLLLAQGYSLPPVYASLKLRISDYIRLYGKMAQLVKNSQMDTFKNLLKEDRGYRLWQDYDQFSRELFAYEDQLNQAAQRRYQTTVYYSTLLQGLLMLLGVPILLTLARQIRHENRQRKTLLLELQTNNQTYLFHAGLSQTNAADQLILKNSIDDLKAAAEFVTQISEGNYSVDWPALTTANQSLNQHNLVGRLVGMREQMKKAKLADERRLWATEGLNRFSDLIRQYQHSTTELADHSLSFLVRYLGSQQGSLFIVRQPADSPASIELVACYAFDRKKYLEKRLSIGQGLVGQTYLEGQLVQLTEIPQGYTSITSGMGDATPTCLVVVPCKHQGRVEALIELAAFRRYEPHELTFLEKAGEFIAAALASVQSSQRVRHLLEESQQQAEQMRVQEEAMRQQMEEMLATQEEMRRKETELARQGEMLQQNALELQEAKDQLSQQLDEALTGMKNQLRQMETEKQKNIAILEGCVDAVITFDQHGRIEFFNRVAETMWNLPRMEVLGKPIQTLIPLRLEFEAHTFAAFYLKGNQEKRVDVRTEIDINRPDGEAIDVLLTLTHAPAGEGHTFTAFIQRVSVELF